MVACLFVSHGTNASRRLEDIETCPIRTFLNAGLAVNPNRWKNTGAIPGQDASGVDHDGHIPPLVSGIGRRDLDKSENPDRTT